MADRPTMPPAWTEIRKMSEAERADLARELALKAARAATLSQQPDISEAERLQYRAVFHASHAAAVALQSEILKERGL